MNGWRSDLVRRFPRLFYDHDGRPTGGYPSVDDGWRPLLTRCCERIDAATKQFPGSVRLGQVKEKFGLIRIYLDGIFHLPPGVREAVDEAVDLAESRSAITCEFCGDAGTLRVGGWAKTACDRHAPDGSTPRRPRPGREHVRIERAYAGGKLTTRARRYNPETDSFSDIPVPPWADDE